MPTYQQHMQALQRARQAGDMEAVEYIRGEAVKAMQAEDAVRYDPTRGMSGSQKVLANLGAGLDSAWQGAKQLVGAGEGDEALQEKRARDEYLADRTTGGTLLQVAGELAPAVVAGGGVGVAARALPAAVQAGRGMQVAQKVMANPVARGAVEGAGAASLMPVLEDESRLANVALGAAGGSAAPYVAKGVVGTGRALKRAVQAPVAAAQQLVEAGGGTLGRFGEGAKRAGGERMLTKTLAQRGITPQVAGQTKYQPHPFIGEKPTASMVTQSDEIAALERASRAASPEDWAPKDAALANARWDALDSSLAKQGDVDALLAKADTIGGQAPYQAVGPKAFIKRMDDFYGALQQAKATPQYHGKPAVRAAVDYVENAMREAGQVTPELLHNIRQTLSKGLTGVPGAGEQGVRAAASEPFVISISQAIDDVLEKASKGKWGRWKADYGDVMTKAEAAKADVNLRNVFVDPTGVVKKPLANLDAGAPDVTAGALKKALASQGVAKRGPRKGQDLLSTGSRDVAEGVLKDLEAQQILQRVKKSGTGLGGSNTAMDLAAGGGAALFDPLLGLGTLTISGSRHAYQDAQKKMLAELLQDPAKLRAFITQQQLRKAAQARLPQTRYAGGAAMLPMMSQE